MHPILQKTAFRDAILLRRLDEPLRQCIPFFKKLPFGTQFFCEALMRLSGNASRFVKNSLSGCNSFARGSYTAYRAIIPITSPYSDLSI